MCGISEICDCVSSVFSGSKLNIKSRVVYERLANLAGSFSLAKMNVNIFCN